MIPATFKTLMAVMLTIGTSESYTIANSRSHQPHRSLLSTTNHRTFTTTAAVAASALATTTTTALFLKSPLAIAGDSDSHMVADKNGKSLEVGTLVRVAVEDLRAYQVPKKGQGYFDDDKKFVLNTDAVERKSKNLKLPVGLRGVVKKIYDYDEISANHPVQVKFTPGENTEEGYDAPVALLMHFSPEEIERVE